MARGSRAGNGNHRREPAGRQPTIPATNPVPTTAAPRAECSIAYDGPVECPTSRKIQIGGYLALGVHMHGQQAILRPVLSIAISQLFARISVDAQPRTALCFS